MKTIIPLAAAACLLSAGCQSLQEIRENSPFLVVPAKGSSDEAADCIANELQRNSRPDTIMVTGRGNSLAGFVDGHALYSIETRNTAHGTVAEFRAHVAVDRQTAVIRFSEWLTRCIAAL